MSTPPAPMTPPESDLRGMPYMPLDIVRLFDSAFYARSSGDEFKAGLSLWAKAFLQIPAGSLPNDDVLLAHLSGANGKWRKVKEMALHGWVECSDGRLYHHTVAEKVLEAWRLRLERRARTAAARAARHAANPPGDSGSPLHATDTVTTSVTERATDDVTELVTSYVANTVTSSKGIEGNRREGNKKERKKGSEATASDSGAGAAAVHGPRQQVFSEGLTILLSLTGQSDRQGRAVLGKLLTLANDDCAKVFSAIWDAGQVRPADPIAWLTVTLSPPKRYANPFLDPRLLDEPLPDPYGRVLPEVQRKIPNVH